jgi:hypothetical protein
MNEGLPADPGAFPCETRTMAYRFLSLLFSGGAAGGPSCVPVLSRWANSESLPGSDKIPVKTAFEKIFMSIGKSAGTARSCVVSDGMSINVTLWSCKGAAIGSQSGIVVGLSFALPLKY